MPVYPKYVVLLLLGFQLSCAQTDTLQKIKPDTFQKAAPDSIPLNRKRPKIEAALIPFTFYLLPDYFSDKEKFLPLIGVSFKYYISQKNALRVALSYSNINKGSVNDGTMHQKNYQKTQQGSIGFQHTFYQQKRVSVYFFADFYFQNFHQNAATIYSSVHMPTEHAYIIHDSTMLYVRQVNSYNLTGGMGLKLLNHNHTFVSIETGLGAGYYPTATQQAYGSTSTNYSNGYFTKDGVLHTIDPSWSTYNKQPVYNTKVSGINLNASIIRVSIGLIF